MLIKAVFRLVCLFFFALVSVASLGCASPGIETRTVQNLEPQDAFRFPLENPDNRLLMLLPNDDKIVLAAISEHHAEIRMRFVVVDEDHVVICDTTKTFRLWKNRAEPVELPILNRYEIEPWGRRLFTVRARVLSQDVSHAIQFKLEIAGLTVSRPRDGSAAPPTSVSELSEH